MPRRIDRHAPDAATDPDSDRGPGPAEERVPAEPDGRPDLSAIPVAGLTPRRIAGVLGALVSIWIVIAFARQAGTASEAAARADDLRLSNAQLAAEVVDLESELRLIQRRTYIAIEARRYSLGKPREIPFSLAPDAPPLAPDAPGSAAVRLGEAEPGVTPVESWLSLLFGPGR